MRAFHSDELNTIWASLLSAPVPANVVIDSLCTDTRTLQRGQAFFAVSGERFDAHQFIAAAVSGGANVVVAEKLQTDITVPQIIVTDVRCALGELAKAIRKDFAKRGGKTVGLTGSVGKTTNKQMLAAIFAVVGKTHATKGNLNNDLGVPFTWFDLPAEADFAVIEMGANHQGEIAYLSAITQPDIGMITNAGQAHLEGFGGLDGVAKGKGELFDALSAGQTAVLNQDDAYFSFWQARLGNNVAIMTFALDNEQADVYARDISRDGSRFVLCYQEQCVAVQLPTVGIHNVRNALGSAACAIAADVSLSAISQGLTNFETAKGRLQRYAFQPHVEGADNHSCNVVIIDDTYNANPTSMRASAEIVAEMPGYRIMVVGDMGELGVEELVLHEQLGRDLRGKADAFYCVGDKMQAFATVNPRATHVGDLPTLQDLLIEKIQEKIREKSHDNVGILIKGSRTMQLERVVEALLNFLNKE